MKYLFTKERSEVKRLPARTVYLMIDPTKVPTEEFSMGITEMEGNSVIPAHSHVSEEEILFIYEGRGIINISGKDYSLERGVTVFIPRGVEHYFRNSHPDKVSWVFIFSPPGYEKVIRQKTH